MRRWRSYYFLVVPVVLLVLAFQFPPLNQATPFQEEPKMEKMEFIDTINMI